MAHGAGLMEKIFWKLLHCVKGLFTFTPPAPSGSVLLGYAQDAANPTCFNRPIFWLPKQRPRHAFLVGGAGMGKSKLLEHMIAQDIALGNGFALFDPHGDLLTNTLALIGSQVQIGQEELRDRVYLLEPHAPFVLTFNPLQVPEGMPFYPQVLSLLDLFRRAWSEYWGPRMEEVFRACLVTLIEHRLTLAELPLLLTEPKVRQKLVTSVRHEETRRFWQKFEELSPTMQALYSEPILNRVHRFLSDPFLKAMLGGSEKGLDFAKLMDEGAILLVNLPKGLLKDVQLLGSLLLNQIYWAALSRAKIPESRRKLFTVYLDEFQTFITEESHVSDMLAECRKFKVSLVMATQCLAFLGRELRASVLANASLQIAFRVNPQDAGLLGSEAGTGDRKMWVKRLVSLPPRHALVLMRGEGKATVMRTADCPKVSISLADEIRKFALSRHGRSVKEVEQVISHRHRSLLSQEQGIHGERGDERDGKRKGKRTKFGGKKYHPSTPAKEAD